MYQTTYPCCTKTVALGTNPNQKEVWHGCLNIFGMGVTRNFFQGGRASTHQPLLRDTHDLWLYLWQDIRDQWKLSKFSFNLRNTQKLSTKILRSKSFDSVTKKPKSSFVLRSNKNCWNFDLNNFYFTTRRRMQQN